MQTITTNAGGMEPAESSMIAVSLNATLLEAHVKAQDPCYTDNLAYGSLAGRKTDEANAPVATC